MLKSVVKYGEYKSVVVELPEGSVVSDVLAHVSFEFSGDVVLGLISGNLVDLSTVLIDGVCVELIDINDDRVLPVLWYDCALLLAASVQDVFPGAILSSGTSTRDGFYYDFSSKRSITAEDLNIIETNMKKAIANKSFLFSGVCKRLHLFCKYEGSGEKCVLYIASNIPQENVIFACNQNSWFNICLAPHLAVKYIGALQLLSVSGVEGGLQRIHGVVYKTQRELDNYLEIIEESKKRDHRIFAKKLNLFHTEDHSPGMVFWHHKGHVLYEKLKSYIRCKIRDMYEEVRTPVVLSEHLWEQSGHLSKFAKNMFFIREKGSRTWALRPMSCPAHAILYKNEIRSYRDLPVRYSEFSSCFRNESSGSVLGILRTRSFIQDDGHIFCTQEQVHAECLQFIFLLKEVYADFGFMGDNIIIHVADRPTERFGDDITWDKSEKILHCAIQESGLPYTTNTGEGSFYGPKLEFNIRDSVKREWQCGTLQLDYHMPIALDLLYVDKDGNKRYPVVLHRAILGSIDRFLGIILENYAGKLPLWLVPIQLVLCTVGVPTEKMLCYLSQITEYAKKLKVVVKLDVRNETLNYKIRDNTQNLIPILGIIGDKETQEETISLRFLYPWKEQKTMQWQEACEFIKDQSLPPCDL